MRYHSKKKRSSRGQAITEYSAVLAFVAVIIATAYNLAQGSLFAGISNSFSSVNSSLQALNSAVANWH